MNLPTGFDIEEWFSDEKDLPGKPTNDLFLVKVKDKETNEYKFSVARFVYEIDYDRWVISYSESYARGSEDNWFDVVAWTKLKLRF